jgi:hypothetical protein
LARDLLGCPGAAEAIEAAARELGGGSYAGCNLLCADSKQAAVLHAGDWLRVRPLPPGIHVLSNADVNDPTDPRVAYASWRLAQGRFQTSGECVKALRVLCASREPAGAPLCFRDPLRGTVSSSVIALPADLARGTYLHAQGPPDSTPFEDYSSLLRQLAREAGG